MTNTQDRIRELYVELEQSEDEIVWALQHQGEKEVRAARAWRNEVGAEIHALEDTYGSVQ